MPFKKGDNLTENNIMWRGNDVGYVALHNWVRRHKPKPIFCERCNINKPYDLANISGEYKRDINDFEWLCRSCHNKKHDKSKNFHQKPKQIKYCKCGKESRVGRCKSCSNKYRKGKYHNKRPSGIIYKKLSVN